MNMFRGMWRVILVIILGIVAFSLIHAYLEQEIHDHDMRTIAELVAALLFGGATGKLAYYALERARR